ncbi:helix-turn-helix transcriptional regulator [Neobacillus pocheonensis]|uniref:helix-turn-helix domain-containing protein n=1 Tax=Neobacillus pocheonensis TaxID=363869 RepID=UPI003D29BC14
MKIGSKFKRIRIDKDMVITDLTKLTGVSVSSISEIENDIRSPRLDTIEKLCSALNIPIMELLPIEHHISKERSLTKDEKEFVELMHHMSPEEREQLMSLLKLLFRERMEKSKRKKEVGDEN